MAEDHSANHTPLQQPQPAPGFFTALLSPLYGSPRALSHRGSATSIDAPPTAPLSAHSRRSQGSNATTPYASPTTVLPIAQQPEERHGGPLSLTSPNDQYDSGQRGINSGGGSNSSSSSSSAARQKMWWMQSGHRSSAQGQAPAMLDSVEQQQQSSSLSQPSSSPSSAVRGGAGNGQPPPPMQQASAQKQQEHGSGACAPHMLGYRQCLEVNPDFKTNCTWALDSYMRCKEDTEL